MRRWFGMLSVLSLLLALISCGGEGLIPTSQEERPWEDLTPAERYETAAGKGQALSSASYQTEVTGALGNFSFETRRVRQGYDGFSFFCGTVEEFVIFCDGVAYQNGALGQYRAPAEAREFEKYWEECLFSVTGLDPEGLGSFTAEGSAVSYRVTDPGETARFLALGLDSVTEVTGTATFNEANLIRQEEITVTGSRSGKKAVVTLSTSLTAYRSSQITVTAPEDGDDFVTVGDLRIPQLIRKSFAAFYGAEEMEATAVTSQSLRWNGESFVLSQEENWYQVQSSAETGVYHSVRALRQRPGGEEFTLRQTRFENGLLEETLYELTAARLMSSLREEAQEPELSFLESLLPDFSRMEEMTLSEGVSDLTVSFTLSEQGQKEEAARILALFGRETEAGSLSDGRFSGTLTLHRESGRPMAVSYFFQASLSGENGETGAVSTHVSLTVENTENVTIPSLQIPTPTIPGQEVEDDH